MPAGPVPGGACGRLVRPRTHASPRCTAAGHVCEAAGSGCKVQEAWPLWQPPMPALQLPETAPLVPWRARLPVSPPPPTRQCPPPACPAPCCRYQGHVSAALVLGGVDFRGPHLFTVYPHGSTDSLPFCTMGSGRCAGWRTDRIPAGIARRGLACCAFLLSHAALRGPGRAGRARLEAEEREAPASTHTAAAQRAAPTRPPLRPLAQPERDGGV